MACGSLERQARDPTNLGFLCSCLACFSPTDLPNFCWSPFPPTPPAMLNTCASIYPSLSRGVQAEAASAYTVSMVRV